MLQPTASVWVVVLLVMTAAEAQPRSLRERSITLAGDPAEPLPEVRVAAGIPLLLLFDAPIDKDSLQLDATRLQFVDAGERSLIIVPVVSPREKEQWVLRVRYADGARPGWAAFALVSRPPEVDGRIDVVRRPQSLESCQAALAEARAQAGSPRAEVWVLAERLGGSAVLAAPLKVNTVNTPPQNRSLAEGTVYRLATGLLLVLRVRNAVGQPPWVPSEVVLRSKENGALVPVRTVSVRPERIGPGEEGQVAVDTELPALEAGKFFTLELRDESGSTVSLEPLELPAAPARKDGGR